MMQHRGYAQQSAAPAGTTWNPSDSAAGIVLSGGNLTATDNVAGSPSRVACRATTSKSTGQFYFEVHSAAGSTTSAFVGFGLGSLGLTGTANLPGNGPTGAPFEGCSIESNGSILASNTIALGGWTNWAAGVNILQVAIDLGAKRVWIKTVAGSIWNNNGSADPATGVGGILYSNTSGALFPMALMAAGPLSGPDVVTANFGASAFSGSVPSGFVAWG